MSTRPELTRRTTDRFLDRSADVSGHPVSALLEAAGAADGVGELAGETVALAQFRAGAHLALAPVPASGRVRRVLTAPVAVVVAVGALATGGGLALAASYGNLDVPFTGHDNRSDKAPAAPSSTNPGQTQASAHHTAEPTDHPSAAPSPSLDGLCRAFQAGAYKDDKKSPAFAALAAAAGGRDQVGAFCTDRIGPPKAAPTHKPKPTQAGVPGEGGQPTQAAQPTKKPPHPVQPTHTPATGKPSKTPKH